MLPSAFTALGRALHACLAQSAGGYVLIRRGQRRHRRLARRLPEYRVNVRAGDDELTTTSGATAAAALQRAAQRLRAQAAADHRPPTGA